MLGPVKKDFLKTNKTKNTRCIQGGSHNYLTV